jgi:hypothetical protein
MQNEMQIDEAKRLKDNFFWFSSYRLHGEGNSMNGGKIDLGELYVVEE